MKRLTGIFLTLCMVLAHNCNAEPTPPTPEGVDNSKYPYVAQVLGTQVFIRSGAGLNHYRCTKISEPAQLVVIEDVNGWSKIVPPKGSFSWISKKYVEKDTVNQGIGIVTEDNVRVWAGSQYVPPIHCSSMQMKLNTGDTVKFFGEEEGDYYRIEPPKGASLFVNTAYLKELGPLSKFSPKEDAQETKEAQAPDAAQTAQSDQQAVPTKAADAPEQQQANAEQTDQQPQPEAAPVVLQTPEEIKGLETYTTLAEQIDAELSKPLQEQDYTALKEALTQLSQDEKAGKAAKYAVYQLERIQAYEAAKAASQTVEAQDQDLAKTREMIRKQMQQKLQSIPDAPAYKVIGIIYPSAIYTGQTCKTRYVVKNSAGKIIAYATPEHMMSKSIIDKYVGKKVGLQGNVVADSHSPIALIEFTQIDLLDN